GASACGRRLPWRRPPGWCSRTRTRRTAGWPPGEAGDGWPCLRSSSSRPAGPPLAVARPPPYVPPAVRGDGGGGVPHPSPSRHVRSPDRRDGAVGLASERGEPAGGILVRQASDAGDHPLREVVVVLAGDGEHGRTEPHAHQGASRLRPRTASGHGGERPANGHGNGE